MQSGFRKVQDWITDFNGFGRPFLVRMLGFAKNVISVFSKIGYYAVNSSVKHKDLNKRARWDGF